MPAQYGYRGAIGPRLPQKVTGSFQYQAPLGFNPAPPAAPAPTLTQQAQGELDPILAQIRARVQQQTANAGKAITGYTGALAKALGSVDYAAPYKGAQQQQAGVDAALSQALAGGGLSDAQGLQSRLAQLGEPGVVDAAAGAVQGNATGNSNAVLAGGSADLGALIANAAAAKSYGQKQPGIARLTGLQDLAGVEQTAAKNITDQTAQVETQLPSIINSLRADQRARQAQAATDKYHKATLAQGDQRLTQGDQRLAQGDARLLLTQRGQDLLTKYRNGELSLRQFTAGLAQQKFAASQAPKPDPSLSHILGTEVDQYGNPIGAGGGGGITSPVVPHTVFQGVDQGVDFKQTEPYTAIGGGTVIGIGSGFHGGTGKAVYIRLDKPVTSNGRTYRDIYYAETNPLVKPGEKVTAGQAVASGGSAELGFANGTTPAATLVGGYNAEGGHTQASQAGQDFHALVTGAGKPPPLPGHSYDKGGNLVTTPKPPRPLTVTEAAKFTKSAMQIATNASQGGTDPKTGVYHKPISREEAVSEMQNAGLFADPRIAKLAMAALNRKYGKPVTVHSGGPLGVTAVSP